MNHELMNNLLAGLAAVVIFAVGMAVVWRNAGARKRDPNDMVEAAKFPNANEAEVWKMRLQSMGVYCEVRGSYTGRLSYLTDAGIRIMVRCADLARAARILKES